MTRARHQRRRGVSLIELLLIISVVTLVLGMCAVLLHTLLRLDRLGRSSVEDSTTLSRLARQFRRDVRASTAARPAGSSGLDLNLDHGAGASAAYRADGARLVREGRQGESVRNLERYAVDRLGPVTFEVSDGRVTMTLARKGGGGHSRTPLKVEAVIGKDRTLSVANGGRK